MSCIKESTKMNFGSKQELRLPPREAAGAIAFALYQRGFDVEILNKKDAIFIVARAYFDYMAILESVRFAYSINTKEKKRTFGEMEICEIVKNIVSEAYKMGAVLK